MISVDMLAFSACKFLDLSTKVITFTAKLTTVDFSPVFQPPVLTAEKQNSEDKHEMSSVFTCISIFHLSKVIFCYKSFSWRIKVFRAIRHEFRMYYKNSLISLDC